jgi:Mg2+-importing ATPase
VIGVGGLSSSEALARLARYGPNEVRESARFSRLRVLWNQLRSPLLLLLVFAALASALTGAWTDALIVVAIVIASAGIGYSREYTAQAAARRLRARIQTRAQVVRDGEPVWIPVATVVPGDAVLLSAGSIVPGDGVIVEATGLYVDEAALTGESFPVAKQVATEAERAEREGATPSLPLDPRTSVFLGTNVRSGTASIRVVHTGRDTRFGAIAQRLTLRPPETEFDRGIRHFGYLLASAMLILVLVIFAANVILGRAPVETLLFSIALAVGLSPELLPAILSVNLARSAREMAQGGVLVRRLGAIENLGSMDVLCTDKTGTLTEGVVEVEGAYGPDGQGAPAVLELASWNAALQTGLANPLDEAILRAHRPDSTRLEKLAEAPYDFVRKRVSVLVRAPGGTLLVTKGAFASVLPACVRLPDGAPLDAAARSRLEERYRTWSARGVRVLGVATRRFGAPAGFERADEADLEFAGFLTFLDRPKQGVAEAIESLGALGVSIKVITGDSRLVAEHVVSSVGLRCDTVLTGGELDALHDEALWRMAERTDLFAEVDPNQKERIILSLKKTGHVVGFLGDGINDAPAMHAADTSLSVETAVDVAREAADFVLLERHLDVVRRGIEAGRRTFANTLKYILTTTSANLGNMASMAVASLFLPFLPLLAGQILLNNFLSDIPAIGLADDRVDPELVDRPRRWDMRFVGRFMIEFGILSSLFDFLTFAVLLLAFAAGPTLFRTGWFVESLLTELVIALVVRTRRPFFRSRPGTLLVVTTAGVIVLALALPFLPFAGTLGFAPLPLALLPVLGGITLLYVAASELVKARFYRGVA